MRSLQLLNKRCRIRSAGHLPKPISLVASILLLFFLAGQANAAITAIPQPDAAYQAATTKIDVASVPDGTPLAPLPMEL